MLALSLSSARERWVAGRTPALPTGRLRRIRSAPRGPAQRTVTVLYLMYEEGFKWWSLGSASAVAFVLFVIMFAITLLQMHVSKKAQA